MDLQSSGTRRPFDLSKFRSEFTTVQKSKRGLWEFVSTLFFRTSPRPFWGFRRAIIRAFGGVLGEGVRIDPYTKIFYPANLEIEDFSVVGPHVDLYNVAPIRIGSHSIISQYSFLCAATHDFRSPQFRLVTMPIVVESGVWVAADAYIGPGVTVATGAVVGARACVYKDVGPNEIVGGNPAKKIGNR